MRTYDIVEDLMICDPVNSYDKEANHIDLKFREGF
jgi:hypothetical protein